MLNLTCCDCLLKEMSEAFMNQHHEYPLALVTQRLPFLSYVFVFLCLFSTDLCDRAQRLPLIRLSLVWWLWSWWRRCVYHQGTPLAAISRQQFSTYDKDNDSWSSSCANSYHGAWWYTSCHSSNLNGEYKPDESNPKNDGIIWYAWKGYYKSMKFSQMKIKQI